MGREQLWRDGERSPHKCICTVLARGAFKWQDRCEGAWDGQRRRAAALCKRCGLSRHPISGYSSPARDPIGKARFRAARLRQLSCPTLAGSPTPDPATPLPTDARASPPSAAPRRRHLPPRATGGGSHPPQSPPPPPPSSSGLSPLPLKRRLHPWVTRPRWPPLPPRPSPLPAGGCPPSGGHRGWPLRRPPCR